MTLAKICGLSTPESVDAALAGGAAYLGFVFFHASPRNISTQVARRLAAPTKDKAQSVALVVDPDDALIDRICGEFGPDLIQLHGRETPARAHQIALRTGRGVIKVIGVSATGDIDAAKAFDTVTQHIMFDAKPPPEATRPGGLGGVFDWTLLQGLRLARPWFLAGGLDPWNVAQAVELSGAPIVDVSSGVERGAGLKDPSLISTFLDAVRRT